MKLFIFILVNFIFINKAFGQTFIEIEIGAKRKVTKVEVKGTFADRDTAFRKFIVKNLNASTFIGKGPKRGKYTVTVYFIIAKDGTLSDIRCENDPGYGMCQEAVRVIKRYSKWPPAPVRPKQ